MRKATSYLFFWACWGFFLGAILLLGPVRWTVDYARRQSWTPSAENSIVYFYIGVLVIVSLGLAYLTSLQLSTSSNAKKSVLFGLPIAGAAFALYVFLNPNLINSQPSGKQVETLSAQFAVGPYPEQEAMQELKNKGYTAIISLLHPAVVPFEPSLMEKEKKNAAEAGLTLINIPLLPWISDNKEAIDSLRRLINTGTGKYYIHCYLGRDRTGAVAKIIRQENHTYIVNGETKNTAEITEKGLERGPVVELEKDVYLAPMPTKEEYLRVVTNFQQVVSLSNMFDKEVKQQVEEEEKWLQSFRIPYKAFNVNEATSAKEMQLIVKQTKLLPKPLFIHGFFPTDKQMVLFKSMYISAL
jgi:protein tyrosine phosphatase (PTP) superfamily phosphohydrolase (DUF442 family)